MWWNYDEIVREIGGVMRGEELEEVSRVKSDSECEGVLADFFYFVNPEIMELYPPIVIIIIVIVT